MSSKRVRTVRCGAIAKQVLLISCIAATLVFAAADALAGTTVAPGTMRMEDERGLPAAPGDVADALEEEVETPEEDDEKGGEFVIAPLPSRSPLLGWTLSLPVMYIYKPESLSAENKPWVSGLGGFYTENDSYGAGLFHKMSLGGDVWRLSGALFAAELNYDYFGIGGDTGRSIELNQEMSLGLAEALREVFFDKFFLGLKVFYSKTNVSTTIPPDLLPPEFDSPTLSADYVLATIAPRMQYDTRDNEFYPRGGLFIDATVELASENIGSDNSYQKYALEADDYRSIGSSGVIASRLVTQYVSGDAPFFLFPAYGADVDLRGYQTGTYRDRFLVAVQVEYRHRFTKRIGAVVFGGIGTVAPKFAEWGKSLPSVGGGLRFVLAPKNDVSLRFDYAWGRDDSQFYVGVGESF